MRRWLLLAILCIGAAAPRAGGAQSTVRIVEQGAITGVVRSADGTPIARARITIEALAMQSLSDSTGSFVLSGIPAGDWTVSFRQMGYRPAVATLTVPRGQTLNLNIALVSLATELDAVVVRAAILNQVGGRVVDERDQPVAGVVVDVIGDERRTETTADGRFLLTDFAPGSYILQFRAPGYRVTQYSVRMVAEIDRDLSIRMRPMDRNDRFTATIAAQVVLESNRRQAMRDLRSVIIGRDELERWDTAPLGTALNATRAANVMRDVNTSCVLVDGFEPVTSEVAGSGFSGLGSRRNAPTSIAGGARSNAPTRATGLSGTGGWLNFFRANEVELVEVYPTGSDNSRTLCNRFPPSSGCACPPEPSGIVVWLKR